MSNIKLLDIRQGKDKGQSKIEIKILVTIEVTRKIKW